MRIWNSKSSIQRLPGFVPVYSSTAVGQKVKGFEPDRVLLRPILEQRLETMELAVHDLL